MEAQVKELIEKIKREGLTQAQTEAASIIESATLEAEEIRNQARTEIAAEKESAARERIKNETASKQALTQAARDCLITLENNIHDILIRLLRDSAGAALTPALMEELICAVSNAWLKGNEHGLAVYLSSHDFNLYGNAIKASLANKISGGIEVFSSPRFQGGLRIGFKSSAQADFSRETLAEIMATRVSTELALLFRTEPEEMK